MSFVQHRDDATTIANDLVTGNPFDLEAFRQRRDVVKGDVVGGGAWSRRS